MSSSWFRRCKVGGTIFEVVPVEAFEYSQPNDEYYLSCDDGGTVAEDHSGGFIAESEGDGEGLV